MLTLVALVVALLFLSSPWNVVLVLTAATLDIAETGVLVWWSSRRRRLSRSSVGAGAIVGQTGVALGRLDPVALDPVGQVRVAGEIWNARSVEPIEPGAAITISSIDGLVLDVEPTRQP
jgi:membrane protein implicated in regulation of membrane protease activity